MDTLTHAVIGAVVARATTPAIPRGDGLTSHQRMAFGGLLAAAPDLDYLVAWVDPLAFIAEWHRSLTHSLVMLPAWLLLCWLMMVLLSVSRPRRLALLLITALSLLSHIGADLITGWGTQILAPLDDYAPAWGLVFVIDPFFSLIIGAGLLGAWYWQSRQPARWSLIVLVAYVAGQMPLKAYVEGRGQQYAEHRGWQDAIIYVYPQPLSPFHWTLIVSHRAQYHLAYIDLLARGPDSQGSVVSSERPWLHRFVAAYRSSGTLVWRRYPGAVQEATAAAWQQPALALYRRFARLPYVVGTSERDGRHCTWFGDLRFALPLQPTAFRYGVCRSSIDASWQLYRLTGTGLSHARLVSGYP